MPTSMPNTCKMPAGRYYVGDLCYVMHSQWDEFCDKTIQGEVCLSGLTVLDNGVKLAHFKTLYGDGVYDDNQGNSYPVDAGLIGCVKVQDINDPDFSEEEYTIIDFPEEFECSEEDGIIYFGHILINTDEDDIDEDDTEDNDR